MSNHFVVFYSFVAKVVYGMLYLFVQHQYSLVNEIGPPTSTIAFLGDTKIV